MALIGKGIATGGLYVAPEGNRLSCWGKFVVVAGSLFLYAVFPLNCDLLWTLQLEVGVGGGLTTAPSGAHTGLDKTLLAHLVVSGAPDV